MNTIRKISLAVLLLTMTTSTFGWTESGKTITVESVDDLWKLREVMVNSKYNHFKDWTILLNCDINAGGTTRNWYNRPIGWYDNHEFQGTFDGQGHTVSNLYMQGEDGNRGLFGDIKNATIKNLKLVNPIIQCGKYSDGNCHVAALAGRAKGTCTITNCAVVDGTVKSYSGYQDEIGGICGFIKGTCNISNCYVSCTISGRSQLGGIVGKLSEDYVGKGSITNCYFAGTLDNHNDSGTSECVGAIIGERNGMPLSNNFSSNLTQTELFGTGVNAYVYLKDNNPELAVFYQYPVDDVFYLRNAMKADGTDIPGFVKVVSTSGSTVHVSVESLSSTPNPAAATFSDSFNSYFDSNKTLAVTGLSSDAISAIGTCGTLTLPSTLATLPTTIIHNVSNAFAFNADCNNFSVTDNGLYNTSNKTLLTIPKNLTTFTVHQKLASSIAPYAFQNTLMTKLYVDTYIDAGTTVSKANVSDLLITADENTFTDAQPTLDIYIKDPTADALFVGITSAKGYGYSNVSPWYDYASNWDDDSHLFSYFPLQRNQGGVSTLMLGYAVELPDGVKAWWCTAANNTSKEATFTALGRQIVPALTPVLLTYTAGTDIDYLTRYTGTDAGASTDFSDNLLKGTANPGGYTLTSSEQSSNFYTLGRQKGSTDWSTMGFYKYTPVNNVMPGNVAYLATNDIAHSQILIKFDNDGATSITEVGTNAESEPVIYTLSGQRIPAPRKGLNIINGRKVFIK